MWNFVWLSESWPLFSNQKILHELPDFRKSERSANKWPAFLLCKIWLELSYGWGFPGGSDGKESACNAETQVWLLGQEDPWERKWLSPPTHAILLAWRILWTKEPGGLQFMRSQRVGHNWATKHKNPVWLVFLWKKETNTPRKEHVKTYRGRSLQARKRGLRRNHLCEYYDLRLLASRIWRN